MVVEDAGGTVPKDVQSRVTAGTLSRNTEKAVLLSRRLPVAKKGEGVDGSWG